MNSERKEVPVKLHEITKVEVPEEFDYYTIELEPDTYDSIMRRLKDIGVEEDILQQLKWKKAVRGSVHYVRKKM